MAGVKRGRAPEATNEKSEIGAKIVESRGDNPVLADVAAASGRVLTRADVARRLGLSVSTIRRLEGKLLKPVVGARGVRYFTDAEVEAVRVRIRPSRNIDAARSEGVVCAEAFALFRDGADPVDVVKRLRVGPEFAERLFRYWEGFGQAATIDRPTTAKIETALSRSTRIEDEQKLVSALFEFKRSSASHCILCHENHARLCRQCARDAAQAALVEEDARKLV